MERSRLLEADPVLVCRTLTLEAQSTYFCGDQMGLNSLGRLELDLEPRRIFDCVAARRETCDDGGVIIHS